MYGRKPSKNKCVYGVGESYRSLREKAGVEQLTERREKMVDRFTEKCLAGDFKDWFPLNNSVR